MSISIQHNPFATRFTSPGEIRFMLGVGESIDTIAEVFRRNRFVSQIVGAHGCGKTALTHALEPRLRDDFHLIRRITIRDTMHVLANDFERPGKSDSKTLLLIIDGFERLPWLHRRMLLKQTRYPHIGLLITTHQALSSIPILYQVQPTLETLRQLTNQLAPVLTIDRELLEYAFEKNSGNIRESLMTLYNWFESRRSCVG